MELSKKYLILSSLFIAITTSAYLSKLEFNQQPRELVSPPAPMSHFSFGFNLPFADMLWIRALQDLDYCEKKSAKNICLGHSWLSQLLELSTELDPKYHIVYSAGATALSVIISDVQGASRLFEKGVQNFPKDWRIHYKAAYHALYEEKNQMKAAALMKTAARVGAPDWVFSLAGRLYTGAGQRELAEQVLLEMRALGVDEKVQERLRQKISETPAITN